MPVTFDVVRLQAAVYGRVTDARTGAPLPGARVEVTGGPAAFTRAQELRERGTGPGWSAQERRPGRAAAAADGSYHLDDLPPGSYTLAVSLPRAGGRYGTGELRVTVQARAGGGITPVAADAALAPTLLEGRVTGPGGTPVGMAEVTLAGGAERALTGADGRWTLLGVETGRRRVRIAARGFQPATRTVDLAAPGAARTLDVELQPG